jgi:hypothetical protein
MPQPPAWCTSRRACITAGQWLSPPRGTRRGSPRREGPGAGSGACRHGGMLRPPRPGGQARAGPGCVPVGKAGRQEPLILFHSSCFPHSNQDTAPGRTTPSRPVFINDATGSRIRAVQATSRPWMGGPRRGGPLRRVRRVPSLRPCRCCPRCAAFF